MREMRLLIAKMTTSGLRLIRMKKPSARSKGQRRSCAGPSRLATQCWPFTGWMRNIAPAQWRRNPTARCFVPRSGQCRWWWQQVGAALHCTEENLEGIHMWQLKACTCSIDFHGKLQVIQLTSCIKSMLQVFTYEYPPWSGAWPEQTERRPVALCYFLPISSLHTKLY